MVRRRILAAVLPAGLVLALSIILPRAGGSGGSSGPGQAGPGTPNRGYPQQVLVSLRQQCLAMPGTKENFCDCAVARVQEKYSYAEFQKLDTEAAERAGLDASFACGEAPVLGGIRATIVVQDSR